MPPAPFTELLLEMDDPGGLVQIYLDGRDTGSARASLSRRGYAPRVHQRRRGVVGGLGLYLPERETIAVNISSGVSATAALGLLEDVIRVIDAANGWAGEGAPPRVRYRPRGSESDELWTGYLLGGSYPSAADVRENVVEVSAGYADQLHAYEITGVQIEVTRGPWLGEVETLTGGAAAVLPVREVLTWGSSLAFPSPLQVEVRTNVEGSTSNHNLAPLLLAVASDPSRLALGALHTSDNSNSFELIDDAARYSYGEYVVQYTQQTSVDTGYLDYGLSTPCGRAVAVYVTRWSSGDHQVRLEGYDQYGALVGSTAAVDLPASTWPVITHLGTIQASERVARVRIIPEGLASGDTFTMDAIVCAALDDATSRVVLTEPAPTTPFIQGGQPIRYRTVEWEVRARQGVEAVETVTSPAGLRVAPLTSAGRADLLTVGDTVVVVALAGASRVNTPFDDQYLFDWRGRVSESGGLMTGQISLQRRRGSIIAS